MRANSLSHVTASDFPEPPARDTGWPWVAEPVGSQWGNSEWPQISIVTPSYNQGKYLEATIRSILLQGYPCLEYIVIDGGSSDESLAILQKYSPWISAWESQPDRGQAHAINKGFSKASGAVLGWINSDDLLLPGALRQIALAHLKVPGALLLGEIVNFDERANFCWVEHPCKIDSLSLVEIWRDDVNFQQPGLFSPRAVFEQAGPLDESFHYIFDREWLCRASGYAPVHYLHAAIAQFRYHPTSKTVQLPLEWHLEYHRFLERYQYRLKPAQRKLAQAALELGLAEIYLRFGVNAPGLGRSRLGKAVRIERKVLRLRKFWRLALKSLLPLGLQKRLRSGYLQNIKRYLYRQGTHANPAGQ